MCFFEQKSLTDTSAAVKEEVGCRWIQYPAGKASRYKTAKKPGTKPCFSADPLASLRTAALRSSFFTALSRLAFAAFKMFAQPWSISCAQVCPFFVLK
jgi:hypothetical protein